MPHQDEHAVLERVRKTREALERLTVKGSWARFDRIEKCIECASQGYPIAFSDEWLLLHTTVDFHFDGYMLLRLEDIQRVSPSRHFERILRLEGVKPLGDEMFDLDNTSIVSILRGLKASGEIVIVDFDYARPAYLYLGRVIRVNKHTSTMMTIDTDGTWDRDVVTFKHENVSTIRLRCEYIRAYAKHVRERREVKR